jgi:molecular chaperone DnaK
MVLLDVTPLSLGVETLGGVMTVLIPRNTTIPTRKDETFSTAEDSQTKVEIHVLQGERAEARANRALGRFHLEGIMPAPRGMPKIKVTFDIDANGILSVTAKDEATGKDQRITITAGSGLSEAEIQKMVKDAELNAAEDKKKLEIVQAKNQGEALVHSVRKSLTEYGDKLDGGEKEKIEAAIKELEGVLKEGDKESIEAKTTALMTTSQKLGEKMYADMQAQLAAQAAGSGASAQGAEGASKPADENVVDAEVKEVKKG